MRQLAAIEVPLGSTVRLKPGGIHLMMHLKRQLKAGEAFLLTISFEKADAVEVTASMAGFVSARLGLVPGWARDGGGRAPAVNARCETIATNGMFRKAYASRRCLVPVDGYFEWQKLDATGKKKQPYRHRMKLGDSFAMAGIWEEYADKETGEVIRTLAIATCEPNALMATIHDRMPVILARKITCAG